MNPEWGRGRPGEVQYLFNLNSLIAWKSSIQQQWWNQSKFADNQISTALYASRYLQPTQDLLISNQIKPGPKNTSAIYFEKIQNVNPDTNTETSLDTNMDTNTDTNTDTDSDANTYTNTDTITDTNTDTIKDEVNHFLHLERESFCEGQCHHMQSNARS